MNATAFPKRRHSGNERGGGMDDILKRLGSVEASVSEMKAQLSAVTAILPHLATKEDVSRLEAGLIKWIIATVISGMALAFVIARYVAP
jgi:hypothetical protein